MNSQGILVSWRPANCSGLLNGCAARSSQGFLERLLRHPPGWPLLEALAIVALVLLVSVAIDLIVILAATAARSV